MPPPGFVPPPDAGGTPPPVYVPVAQPSRRPVPRRLIAAALGVAVAGVAAFLLLGNGDADPIARAATVSESSPGYRMALSLLIGSSQPSAPLSATGSAVVDPPDHAASMSLTVNMSQIPLYSETTGASTMQMAMVLNGRDYYLKLPQVIVNQMPSLDGKPWVEVDVSKAAMLSSLGDSLTSDPSQTLQAMQAGAEGITNEGQQEVDGIQTTHYHAGMNLSRLVPGLPSSLAQQLTHDQDVPVDVWIDAHNLIRRVVMSLTAAQSTGPSLAETVTADFSDYGPQPRPTPPPADQVTEASSIAGLSR